MTIDIAVPLHHDRSLPRPSWAQLVMAPGGPAGVHDRVIAQVRRSVARTGPGLEFALAGGDEAFAATTVLRGPRACRGFVADLAPAVTRLGRLLSIYRDGIDDRSLLDLTCIAAIAETTNQRLDIWLGSTAIEIDLGGPRSMFNTDRAFNALALDRTFSVTDRAVVALLALAVDRPQVADLLVRLAPKPVPTGSPFAIVTSLLWNRLPLHALARSWHAMLQAFPAALADGHCDWRCLVLAARLVLPRIEGIAVGDVAARLHRHARYLAAAT